MEKQTGNQSRLWATILFVIMLVVNMSAALFPINGMKTQDISQKYETLFAPAGVTFAIWSVIYLLLAAFLVYQWMAKARVSAVITNRQLLNKVNWAFSISSILNCLWLFTWQFEYLLISTILMLGLVGSLFYLNYLLRTIPFDKKEYVLIRLPFSVYFGWITVATIANISATIVQQEIPLFMKDQPFWTNAALVIGLVVAVSIIIDNRNIAYGLAVIWGYLGVLLKHESASGWDQRYPSIITTTIISLILLVIACIFVAVRNMKRRKKALI
ncbi:tryptophan-rich sensory protein [Enterococcus faecalis]